jgi:hypothetical protein
VIRSSALVFAVAAIAAIAGLATHSSAQAGGIVPVPDFPVSGGGFFLRECAPLKEPKRRNCFIRELLAIVEKSGDPATEIPVLDHTVRASGGYIASNCHILMHAVGRQWAARHHVTLESMFKYVPKSNDPGCSAGFGMGMVMYLGKDLILKPRSVIPTCTKMPTRFREFTCFHGSGHAFMRGYHGQVAWSMRACKLLGPSRTPDCAQGVFHDYWISLGGNDGAKLPEGAVTDPRTLCGSYAYPRPCWYRYFWERRQSATAQRSEDVVRLCKGIEGEQRAGCIGGASLLLARVHDPAYHAHLCGELSAVDALNCLRGVNVPVLAGDRYEQLRLIRECADHPKATRNGCYSWFGRTLNVVTNGKFESGGCRKLGTADARAACVAGARKYDEPLGTFS